LIENWYDNIVTRGLTPWKSPLVLEFFATLIPYTLVDDYRKYELYSLVCESAKLSEGILIEAGV